MAQFNHCPLIWMCQNRTYNNEINRLDERCLQLICTDTRSSLEALMEKDYSVSMHTKNLEALATKMFRFTGGCCVDARMLLEFPEIY